MIGALSDAQRKDMRAKIIGLGLFHKVKADWGYNRTWTNDYLKGEPGFGPAWKALRDKGVRIASRSIRPDGGQLDFVWLSARTRHVGPQYVWCLTARRNQEQYPPEKYYRSCSRSGHEHGRLLRVCAQAEQQAEVAAYAP